MLSQCVRIQPVLLGEMEQPDVVVQSVPDAFCIAGQGRLAP